MKKICILTLTTLAYIQVSAQITVIGGLGLSVSPPTTKYINIGDGTAANTQVYSYNGAAVASGIFAYPKYHLKQEAPARGETGKIYSISVGLPLILGAQFSNFGNNFSYSVYPTVDVNVGSCNVNRSENAVGAYFGLGFGIQNTNNILGDILQPTSLPVSKKYRTVSGETNIKGTAKSIGPMMHVGFEFPSLFYRGTKNGLRFAFQPALNKQGPTYFTICLQQGGRGIGNNF